MWWQFKSAIARKLGYALVAAALAFLGYKAHSQSCFGYHDGNIAGSYYSSLSAACSADLAFQTALYGGVYSLTISSTSGPGIPSTSGTSLGSCTYAFTVVSSGASAGTGTSGMDAVAGACPAGCAGLPNMDIITAIAGNTGAVAGSLCVNACSYTNSANTLVVGGKKATVYGQAVPTGAGCGANTGTQGNCASGGGSTTCYDDSNGKAVVNGEVIEKTDIGAPGSCVQYPSGGTMCTYSAGVPLATPPAPSVDGTTVDEPVAVVGTGGATPATQGAVFTAAQNAASANPVGGTSKGNPTAAVPGAGTGTGSGGPNAANGDCGADGVNCTSDGTVPSLSRDDTIQSNIQGYVDSVKAAPIVAAFSSIATSWPDASCPSLPMSLFGKDVDLMTGACTTWATNVAPLLSLVFLAIWAVGGIKIIMSA